MRIQRLAFVVVFGVLIGMLSNSEDVFARKAESKEERAEEAEAVKNLPSYYQTWLNDVSIIMLPEERSVFVTLTEDWEREVFIDYFWAQRPPGYRAEFESRLEYAKKNFGDMSDERVQIWVLLGPTEITSVKCEELVPIQVWFYPYLEVLHEKEVFLVFYCPHGMCFNRWRLWVPSEGDSVFRDSLMRTHQDITTGLAGISGECGFVVDDLRRKAFAVERVLGPMGEKRQRLFMPPPINKEYVERLEHFRIHRDPHALTFTLSEEPIIRYAQEAGTSAMVSVDLVFPILKSELAPQTLGDKVSYKVDVIVQVLKWHAGGGFEVEHGIVREARAGMRQYGRPEVQGFNFEENPETTKFPVAVRVRLRPGVYFLALRIVDRNLQGAPQGRETEWEGKIVVPTHEELQATRVAPPPAVEEKASQPILEPRVVNEPHASESEGDKVVRAVLIVPMGEDALIGNQRVFVIAIPEVKKVKFQLDGHDVFLRNEPPFTVDMQFGPVPRRHEVRAIGLDAAGNEIDDDRLVVNDPYRQEFRVHIVSPKRGMKSSGPLLVEATVALGDGDVLLRVEIYKDDALAALPLTHGPFRWTVDVAPEAITEITIVALLTNGLRAEERRFVNFTPDEEIDVHETVLYVSVQNALKHYVEDLSAADFMVYENSVQQKLNSFRYMKDVPLNLGVMVDISGSMFQSINEAVEAGAAFVSQTIDPEKKDRAFVMGFGTAPHLLRGFTSDREELMRAFREIRVREESMTAFYDAVVSGLYRFEGASTVNGVTHKNALVILTDGVDTASTFSYDTALQYAQRANVTIYIVGLRIPEKANDRNGKNLRRQLSHLADVTGGRSYFVDAASDLKNVYGQINSDLRIQYELSYTSTTSPEDTRWRSVEVKVQGFGLKVRTRPGYYP